ncbi:hypothetical protein MMSR116_29280 [Methylobacterium mesophilicum SR1.6/6]|uniref:Uncharacterized protein n=1 Tax=Methylobacterium mesophilicum SR1.6/6 TaxID=908290 RepID=A0A6B9FSF9_9HYPH|nr:hypothetical protein [Methylobacterium mesophilicum]QGY05530.1 hypothetical protein MMSR116_29280 [Methylobacterium mesophilicum SR1.6/6]
MADHQGTSRVIARSWSVEKTRDAAGRGVVLLRLLGDGFSLPSIQLTPALAASLSGRLGLAVAELLTEIERER